MQLLALFLLVVATVWVWRRLARDAATKGDGADPDITGGIGRRRLSGPTAGAVLATIDEPARAAIVLMVSLGDCKPEWRGEVYAEIERQAMYLFDTDDVEDIMRFAYGIVDDGPDPDHVIRTLAPLWNARLDPAQKTELLQMAHEVAAVGGTVEPRQKAGLIRLRQVLRIDQRA